MIKRLLFSMMLLVSTAGLAWNGDGHRIVAHIAYEHLTPIAKQQIDRLTYPEGKQYRGRTRFLYLSTWADRIRFQDNDKRFDRWHYISLPISADGTRTEPALAKNAVWAIEEAKRVLTNPNTPISKRRLYLKLLVHIVGDIHQPLHTVSRYSWKLPHGDRGGNLVSIYDVRGQKTTLHRLWDNGLGWFRASTGGYTRQGERARRLATRIERQFPPRFYGQSTIDRPTLAWAKEGRYIANTYIYKTQPHTRVTPETIQQGQRITKQRLALGGYRLAKVLNQIFR